MPACYYITNQTTGARTSTLWNGEIYLSDLHTYSNYEVATMLKMVIFLNFWGKSDLIRAYPSDPQLPVLLFNCGEMEWGMDNVTSQVVTDDY